VLLACTLMSYILGKSLTLSEIDTYNTSKKVLLYALLLGVVPK
jgi:hypothetical protein